MIQIIFIIVIIVVSVLLFRNKKTKKFFEDNHNILSLFLTTLGIVIAGLFANNIVVRIDNIDASIKDFYSGYTEIKHNLKDLSTDQFMNLSKGSQIEILLKGKPIPLSMRVWFGSKNGEELLGPSYYEIEGDVIKLKLPNPKEGYLGDDLKFIHLIYQEDK